MAVGLSIKLLSPSSETNSAVTGAVDQPSDSSNTPTGQIAGITLPPSEETASGTTSQETVSSTIIPEVTQTEPKTNSQSTPMTIMSITGEVFVRKAGTTTWIPATIGMTLQPDDAIKTGDNSDAEVTFFEGSIIELVGLTILDVSNLGIADSGSTTIGLKQEIGKTISRVQKLTDQESKYEIETPAAVAAVRGSVMVIIVEPDGTTIVANEGGDIRVFAQGVEVIIPVGMQVTIIPGYPPGQPVPIGTQSGGGGGSSGGGGGGGGGGGTVLTANIDTGVQPNISLANIGDTITYTYSISNTGDLQILSVSISDNVAGTPSYVSGDTNSNSKLDPGETWIFSASHVVGAGDPSPLVNTATFSALVGTDNVMVATESAQVLILPAIIPLSISTQVLPVAEVGAEYSESLLASGGSAPYNWSVAGGTLPDGLNFSSTGSITGTPTTTRTSNFTIRVTDSTGNTATNNFSISVNGALTIDTDSLAGGRVGIDYSQSLAAANGTPPCTWSIIRGNLPGGLQLGSSGSITGKPTTPGSFVFTIRVTDKLGVTVTKEFTIIISN